MAKELGSFDVVIVGAGTAGCLLANRLSADRRVSVALLEAGGSDDYLWVHVPVGYLYCIGNPRTDWCFETAAEPGLNGRAIRYPRGRVLGGCSSINGMIYMRGQRQDYDEWRAGDGYGPNPGWGWDDVLALFKQHEDFYGGADAMHGAGREWRVEKPRVRWEILDAFRAAATEQGIPPNDDFNRGNNFGCGYFDVNQRAGVRWNTAKAFLHRVKRRRNLALFTQTQALRLIFEGDRCGGVEVRRGDATGIVRARGEVLLAAGAIGSPHLLQLSGIGPRALLQRHGVAVRHDLAGVGGNLQDHLQLRMVFGVSGVKTLNTMASSWIGKAQMALQYALTRSGPLSMSPSQLGAFASTAGDATRPNVEYHVQPLSLDKFGEPLHPFNAFTASVCNLRPTSRGQVAIDSADPLEAPVIAPNYLSTEADRQVAAAALRLTRRIVASPALAAFQPNELRPGPALQTDEELMRAAGDIGTTIFHPVGTAKMGPAADPSAVVDAELRVHGVHGVRVIDASIMPTITSGNTNAPTLMIAEQGARLVAAALGR
ncbi:MAG: GMC family oxidoreductase N-terminal domain-containing protein [Burkholderiaceae bacterium]|jgi:choline dehydrogenase|nr:GMC family oxidoreductase N-terminal domain-containing protein [Burkholderiaceae bacterium]